MKPNPTARMTSLDLFCRVIDNYGDIGICWRLARQLWHEHGIASRLWVDDLASFRRLCPAVSLATAVQVIDGVTVQHWTDGVAQPCSGPVAEIVIEFFGCDLPHAYLAAMGEQVPAPVWLNLEGLSAEAWVEGCHRLPSPHPQLGLMKHFFFPGFTPATGGLLREAALDVWRQAFQADPMAIAGFFARIGVTAFEQAGCKVSLFCYPEAPVAPLFAAWEAGAAALTCLVPHGVAVAAVTAFLGRAAEPGAAATRGALTVRVLPFLPQDDYDRLLWACDVNFVRGEDSWVRAQWAGKPFVWHIYLQEENLHHKKLRAFLQRYPATPALQQFSLDWNGAGRPDDATLAPQYWRRSWQRLRCETGEISAHAHQWQQQMQENGDLATNLLQFAIAVRSASP